jgi:hypothetical protein
LPNSGLKLICLIVALNNSLDLVCPKAMEIIGKKHGLILKKFQNDIYFLIKIASYYMDPSFVA